MAKIDSDKLTEKIKGLDPYYYDSVTMKWEILKIIKAMEEKNIGRKKEMANNTMDFPETVEEFMEQYKIVDSKLVYTNGLEMVPIYRMKQWFNHQMSVEQYRQRMIQAFHNADCDEFIALVALPSEKEFKHLEWLLKDFKEKKDGK